MQQSEEKEMACDQCSKKERLIDKYLNLIDLLKKKSDKSLMSTTLRRSTDTPVTHSLPRAALPYLLLSIVQRSTTHAFLQIQRKHMQANCHRGYLFVQTMEKLLNKRVLQTARRLLQEGSGWQLEGHSISRNQSCCSASAYLESEKREKVKGLTRRVFELTQQVQVLRAQKRSYDEQIEQNLRRQQVESKKKKESLQMLAEEMAQKNEAIAELQAAIRFYEHRQGRIDNNILEDDNLSIKRDLEQAEKLNQKLSVELQRKSEQLQRTDQQLISVKQRMAKLQAEYSEVKQRNFQLGIEMQDLEKRRQEYAAMNIFLEKKLTSLKKYEKLITANLRVIEQASISDRSSFNTSQKPRHSRPILDQPASETNLEEREKEFAPITKFQAQYKVEKILNYLYNIELDDVWIANDEKLFDQEELNVLNQLKLKFIHLNAQLKPNPKQSKDQNGTPAHKAQPIDLIPPPARLSKQCGQSDEVYFNEQHVSGSIFEVFGSEKASKGERDGGPAVSEWRREGDVTTRRAEQGFTIKLLQMQIEKNKQVEKISQLKNKLFHIRSIVMNFIKSLDFKTLRPESKDIIDVCFQFFEYSEEEKEVIFHTQIKKEKRFLGLF